MRSPLLPSPNFTEMLKKPENSNIKLRSFETYRSSPNGVYNLQENSNSDSYRVYCHMSDLPGCYGGGWTLVLKVDGSKVSL